MEKGWQMQFHPDKCQVLRITNKRKPIIFNYTLHDHILATVTQPKYVGVTITNYLNWNQHVDIIKSANKALGFLRRNLRINSVQAKEQPYLTYVRPILEYSCTVWDPYRIYQQRQLEMVQRRAARFVCNRYRQTSSVTNMMAGLDWEPLLNRRRACRMFMFFKMHSGPVAIHPTLYLTPRQYHTSHKCRISQHFVGALSYADDITLLSPSLKGLQCMVNICEEHGKEFHVTFNDKKTTGMVFGTINVNCKAIQVNGNYVDWVSNAKHLGNVVDDKLSDLKDINAKKVILLQVLTGLLATSEAKCLLNVIFVYFSHTAVHILAQFYGHYMI